MIRPYKTTVSVITDTRDLTVLETVKQELSITGADKDALFARLISEQSEVAMSWCQREFAQETLIDSFRLDWDEDRWSILLARRPVISIAAVVENDETLTSADYELNASTGELWRVDDDDRIGWNSGKVVVTYVGGYELLVTLPRDIERGVIELIKHAYYATTRDPMVRSEEVAGVGSTDFWVGSIPGSDMPPAAMMYLAPYRDLSL